MRDAVLAHLEGVDVLVAAAAVADYRPESVADRKIKKGEGGLEVRFVRNPDILTEVSRSPHPAEGRLLIGFAAETDDLEGNAHRKLLEKELDLIVANPIGEAGAGFASETNQALILDRQGGREEVPRVTKEELARHLWDRVVALGSEP
jgi:phosphopantothenoylcysteine decarboxylase/phosphopantothenate--cysteine ligase